MTSADVGNGAISSPSMPGALFRMCQVLGFEDLDR